MCTQIACSGSTTFWFYCENFLSNGYSYLNCCFYCCCACSDVDCVFTCSWLIAEEPFVRCYEQAYEIWSEVLGGSMKHEVAVCPSKGDFLLFAGITENRWQMITKNKFIKQSNFCPSRDVLSEWKYNCIYCFVRFSDSTSMPIRLFPIYLNYLQVKHDTSNTLKDDVKATQWPIKAF